MAFLKQTAIVGKKAGKLNYAVLKGHWSLEAAHKNALRRGVTVEKIMLQTLDNKGLFVSDDVIFEQQ